MEVSIFSHYTALNAVRSTRTWRGEIPWPACTPEEQRRALTASTGRLTDIDPAQLRALGVLPDSPVRADGTRAESIHILVSDRDRRVTWNGGAPHYVTGALPTESLLRVTSGVYICRPELAFIQVAPMSTFADLLKLGYELMGLYTLKPNGTYGFAPCEQAMTQDSLTCYLDRANGMRGTQIARQALPYLLERSRSPMETAMVLMLTLPHGRGGFGLKQPLLNHTVQLTEQAQKACGRSSIECDAFFPEALVDLEYNSFYHNNEQQRRRDDERAAALACMGIQVISVSISQFCNLEKLEAIARLIAKRSHRQYRIRSKTHAVKQAALHGTLCEGLGAPDIVHTPSRRPSESADFYDDFDAIC